jgi:hypothetical protein
MIVNFATEDETVSESAELASLPPEGTEIEISDGRLFTVDRARLVVGSGEGWCLLKLKGGEGGGKKPKRPHPFK